MFLFFLVKGLGTPNFHDPWVGTDTPGPGEAAFAIRFIEKPAFTFKKLIFQDFKKLKTQMFQDLSFQAFPGGYI